MTGRDYQLIWMAGVSWDGTRGTERHIATTMSRHASILWVDSPVSPVTPSVRRHEARRLARLQLFTSADKIGLADAGSTARADRTWRAGHHCGAA